jgi:hypothetical protein
MVIVSDGALTMKSKVRDRDLGHGRMPKNRAEVSRKEKDRNTMQK